MSTSVVVVEPAILASPRLKSRIAGAFYLVTFVAGILTLVYPAGRVAGNLIGDVCYIAVALLLYDVFKPVNRNLSLAAMFVGLAGCVQGILSIYHLAPLPVSSLVIFGIYCLLLGRLIYRSTFLPRILGIFMAIAGLAWLTFISPEVARHLSPFNMIPGAIGEGAFNLWLLVFGVNGQRWREQAGAARETR